MYDLCVIKLVHGLPIAGHVILVVEYIPVVLAVLSVMSVSTIMFSQGDVCMFSSFEEWRWDWEIRRKEAKII